MKKNSVLWILLFLCNFIYGQNKICLTENFEKIGKLPKEINKNFEVKKIYEAYQFCGSKVSKESKGTYYIFLNNSQSNSSVSKDKSYLSQIIYVDSDSKDYEDLLYISENDYYVPQFKYKKIYGRDYIKFDDYGTIFINVIRHSTKQSGVLMYSPVNNSKRFFALPDDFSFADDFEISNNGKYLVINADNGTTNFSHQAFLYKTEDLTAEPESLLYMLSEELSSIVFNPENQCFYMMVAFYDLKKEFDDRCGFIVLRPEKQMYSKDNVKFYNRQNVTNGDKIDFWFNILLYNESDYSIYGVNHKETYESTVYKIVDRNDYIETINISEMEFIKIRNSQPPIYKISMKKTPVGLYVRDVDNNVYLYQNEKVVYTNEEEVNQQIENYYENLLKENSSVDLDAKNKILERWILILSIIIGFLLISFIFIILIYVYVRNKMMQKIMQKKMLDFQESERAKLSRDIHDSVVQDIRAIRLQTEVLDVGENQKSLSQKNRIIEDISQTIVKMRNICYNLTPAELMTYKDNDSAEIELISIYDSLCQQFYVKSKIPCSIIIDKNLIYPKFSKEVTIHLIRVFQEMLNNIEKHSYATNVNVLIRNQTENDQQYLVIFVIDDGIGCNIEQVLKKRKKNHFGLTNIQERINLIDGKIEFFSSENQGMKIKLTLKM